jgi:hypothetical protein
MKKVYCDELIKKLQLIRQNRCSFSAVDRQVIDEVIELLKTLPSNENKEPTSGLEKVSKVVELLIKLFALSHEVSDILSQIS